MQTVVRFELSKQQMNYFRQVETVFDLLASLGGFFSALSLFCGLFVTAFHFYGSYQFLMDNLFLEKQRGRSQEPINDNLGNYPK